MGFWALWLKKALFPPLPLLYISDGELCEEDLAEYSSLVRPYQDEPLTGKDTTETKTNSTQMGSLQESCGTDTKEPRHHCVIITCGSGCHCVSPALCVFVLLSGRDPYKVAGLLSVELLCRRSARIPASEGYEACYWLLHLPKIACAGSKLARNVRNREQSIPIRRWPYDAGRIESTVSVNGHLLGSGTLKCQGYSWCSCS